MMFKGLEGGIFTRGEEYIHKTAEIKGHSSEEIGDWQKLRSKYLIDSQAKALLPMKVREDRYLIEGSS